MLLIEQRIAERLQSLFLITFADKERNVIVAAAERNHTHRYVAHGIERLGFKADVLPFEVAYHADDTHILVYRHRTVFLQIVQNLVEMLGIVDRDGYAYLGRTNHVDRYCP